MRALRLAPVLLLAAGCGTDFTPRSVVFDARVLAVVADPLEVGPSDPVTLTAFRVGAPGGTIVSETWSFCPFSAGSQTGYACAVPECETTLSSAQAPAVPLVPAYGPSASITATPGALALACLAALSGSGTPPAGGTGALPEKVEVLFRYTVTASDGSSRESVQRLPLYPAGAPADRNLPPSIDSVAIGRTVVWAGGAATGAVPPALATGVDQEVLVDVSGAQTYVEGGRTLTEQLVVSFYTTAGRFDFDFANGPAASVTLKRESVAAGTVEAQVWAVARDLRGGETVVGPFAVPVHP